MIQKPIKRSLCSQWMRQLRLAHSPLVRMVRRLPVTGWTETRLWDLATGVHKQTLNRSTNGSITFSPDNQTLAIGLDLWDASTGGQLRRVPTGVSSSHEYPVFSPDGKTLAGFSSGALRLFHLEHIHRFSCYGLKGIGTRSKTLPSARMVK